MQKIHKITITITNGKKEVVNKPYKLADVTMKAYAFRRKKKIVYILKGDLLKIKSFFYNIICDEFPIIEYHTYCLTDDITNAVHSIQEKINEKIRMIMIGANVLETANKIKLKITKS